jgi:hypothetical protein
MKEISTSLPLVFLFFLMFFVPLSMLRSSLAQRVLRLVSDDAGMIATLTLLGGSIFAAPVSMLILSVSATWLEEWTRRSSFAAVAVDWANALGGNQPTFQFFLMAICCCAIACVVDMLIIRWWVQGGRCPDLDVTHPQSVLARFGQSSFSGPLIFCWVAFCNVVAWAVIVFLVASLAR